MKPARTTHAVGVTVLLLGLWILRTVATAQTAANVDFDHLRTGFPLTGAHRLVDCETCHVGGRFKGTPTQCSLCHMQGSRIADTVKPANHFPTQLPCDQCHTSTSSWTVARFSHGGVVPGACSTCHNNAMAPGKPGNHVVTNTSCDACHRTTAWSPAAFNHANVTPGACETCHNGSQATGKPSGHVATSASCDACHRTTAWLPATFDHNNVSPGTCETCHNGTQATGKPSGHFVTTRACDACHTMTAWEPARAYTHISPGYQPHSSIGCTSCHTANSEAVSWPYAAYKPDCAGCHAGDFKPDAHKKTETTTATVDELRNCGGGCHLKDGFRSSEHRSTDGGF